MLPPFLIMMLAPVEEPVLQYFRSESDFRSYCLNMRLPIESFTLYEVMRALGNYSTVNVLVVPDLSVRAQDILEVLTINYMGLDWPTLLRVPDAKVSDAVNMQTLASKLTMTYWCETNFK